MSWPRARRLRLDPDLLERAEARARQAGYATLAEFVEHCVEKELLRAEAEAGGAGAEVLRRRLRGLGYVE